MKHRSLKAIAADIRENANNIHESKISWEEFSARNHALWREVDRGELPIIGSACAKRTARVHAYLRAEG